MIRYVLLLTLLATLVIFNPLSSKAGIKDSIGVTKINNVLHVRYLVEPGETIYGISTKYHVSISDLLELNPELESGLKVGQVINIPYNEELVQRERAKRNAKVKIHKVKPGETLYSLSREYNVSIEKLMEWNGMGLKAGQEIVVGQKTDETDTEPKPKVSDEKPAFVTEGAKKDPVKEESEPLFVRKPKEEPKPVQETRQAESEPEPKPKPAPEPEPKSKLEVKEEVAIAPDQSKKQEQEMHTYPFDPSMKQILIIPFDPYLYFSDADHEIAAKSQVPPTKVRQIFRKRLSAMMQMPGYESIFLLGGKAEDSLTDLNKIYSSVSYKYNPTIKSKYFQEEPEEEKVTDSKAKNWFNKQKDKLLVTQSSGRSVHDKYEGEYFGVKIRNPEDFFAYFQKKYSVDYYIFINQFEVKTNYENCLDRAAHNFERTFTTHFSIFDETGNQISGNKFKTFYNSNSSYIYTIVADNMGKIAERILAELPPPGTN